MTISLYFKGKVLSNSLWKQVLFCSCFEKRPVMIINAFECKYNFIIRITPSQTNFSFRFHKKRNWSGSKQTQSYRSVKVINLLMPYLAFPVPQESMINTPIHFMLLIKTELTWNECLLFCLSTWQCLYYSEMVLQWCHSMAGAFWASLDSWTSDVKECMVHLKFCVVWKCHSHYSCPEWA